MMPISRLRFLILSSVFLVFCRLDNGMGIWIDDRPQRITIEAQTTDSSLVSVWSAPTESGRTEYVIAGPDSVVVRDFVDVDGSPRPFRTAMYSRSR